jgi:hydrogenase small subunit
MNSTTQEIPIIWLQAGSCSGCSVSVLNSVRPSVRNLVVDEILPGIHLSLRFHMTLMAGSGEPVVELLETTEEMGDGAYLLVVEGAVATADDALYCVLGEDEDGRPVTMMAWVEKLARRAMAVIALGTCASFGGIPAGAPNPTGAVGLQALFTRQGVSTPLINVPGCPPHPDWFVGTVADILLFGLPGPEKLDAYRRPLAFYAPLVHEHCPRRAYFDEGKFARKPGEPGCLYYLGCKGPVTHADCPLRMWNGGTNWCIGAGSPCHGCVEPGFPDLLAPFYEPLDEAKVPPIGTETEGEVRG